MNYYRIIFAYDGTDFLGWQKQENFNTIEDVVCQSFTDVFHCPVTVLAASRTDAGVHACGQVVRLATPLDIDPRRLQTAWNNVLKPRIMIRKITTTDQQYHPRKNIVYKEYRYHIFTGRPSPFVARYGWHVTKQLNVRRLQEALSLFVGTHNFALFCSESATYLSTHKTIDLIMMQEGTYQGSYRIIVRGHSFLRHMIRRIVGICVRYATDGVMSRDIIQQALHEQKLDLAHRFTAPPSGLVLYTIVYQDYEKEEPDESFFIL